MMMVSVKTTRASLLCICNIVPCLDKMLYLTVPVLQQIKNIKRMLEMEIEIENSVNADNGTSNNAGEVMIVARESFL
jgi:hypothetical protein